MELRRGSSRAAIYRWSSYNGDTLMTLFARSRCGHWPLRPFTELIGEAMRTAKQLDEMIALPAALFPKTFAVFQKRLRPLKLGIHLSRGSARSNSSPPRSDTIAAT